VQVDVLVGGEEDPVAVLPQVGEVGEGTDAKEVAGSVEGEAIGGVEPLVAEDFFRNGAEGEILNLGRVQAGHAVSWNRELGDGNIEG
jgi:hypothetical protein